MGWLIAFVGLIGIADGVWLTLRPQHWAPFWRGVISRVGQDRTLAIGLGLAEIGFSLSLLRWKGCHR